MQMPVLDGYQATQKIRSYLQGQATIIIALTASAFEEKRAVVLAAGCDDYVCKPFRESIIWQKMAKYLGVSYLYEEITPSSLSPAKPNFSLENSALEVMPTEWITQLEKATLELNEELIAELLAQIPQEYTLLKQILEDKLNNFDFGKILELARQAHTY